ncbi:MAG: N-6 DNA methylase [Fusobacteriaceae bacterium]|nr:N-6 DNA methylase [Fusobacteriaceae bacterium]MDY3359135.1 N-6 DNA methylase [Clostridium celatum]
MVGLSIANVSETNFNTFIEHEEQYKKIVDKYTPTDLEKFAKCVALLVELLENKIDDYLGKMYHELELHNKDLGQFFTPYGVSCAMSKMVINKVKESDKVITVYEPTCGSGSTVLALLEELKNQGINYQTRVHLTCTDLDSNVLMMCYIQLSLLGAKATCIVEDSLANKQFDRFYTFRNFC